MQIFYSLQSVGLVPPVIYFAFLAKTAKNAEDKTVVRRWAKKMALKFILIWIVCTMVLFAVQSLTGIKIGATP